MGFVCKRCGRCCAWEGVVKLESGEPAAIAAALGLGESEFIERYTRLRLDRTGLALCENSDGSCIFLTWDAAGVAGCEINSCKPRQCRDFPEKWNFPGWRKECGAND